jgi:protein-tyrosine-phosphatase/DNA-binding HxlR family transcriptional regulator
MGYTEDILTGHNHSVKLETMNFERLSVEARARIHAALGDAGRLRIVDTLGAGDASPAELATLLTMPSNLLAHHLKVLESAGLVTRRHSDGDARRVYLRLLPETLAGLAAGPWERPARVVFVCTANSARSQLAVALWRDTSTLPVASAGTHPAPKIAPGARQAARRHRLPLQPLAPVELSTVLQTGDLVVTVCDNAHEELGGLDQLHWSVPDPVPLGTAAAYDDVIHDLGGRVHSLAARMN